MPFQADSQIKVSRAAGFTLVEALVTLAVTALLVVGILGVFDFNNKVARVQTQVADMQQSLRVAQYEMVRYIRMAGRGGVPADRAVELRDNVGEAGGQGTILAGEDEPLVLRGSDVITVRGVFTTPVYQLDYVKPEDFDVDEAEGTGLIRLRDPSPTGIPQDLTPIREMMGLSGPPDDKATKEALILVSPIADNILAVVEFDPDATFKNVGSGIVTEDTPTGKVTTATIIFRFKGGSGNADEFAALAGGGVGGTFPLASAVTLGILEEYRFYLRDVRLAPGPDDPLTPTRLAPKLAMARVFPGTEKAYRDDKSNYLKLDLADNILDLQVALGMDRDGDGEVEGPPLAASANEWLYDDTADAAFTGSLGYVRINTIARTGRPDRDFRALRLEPLEDRVYKNTDLDLNDPASPERFYRRRVLQTIVDLRNLG